MSKTAIEKYPKSWEARPVDIKSGWKNNANLLGEMVTAINNEIYIEDETDLMEKVDVLLEWMKSKYFITDKPSNKPQQKL